MPRLKKKIIRVEPERTNPLNQLAAKYSDIPNYDYEQPHDKPIKKDPKWERQEIFIDCFITCHGHIQKSCEMSKVSRNTFYVWLREEPEFAERLQGRKLEWESQFHSKAAVLALNGNTTMLKFLLEFLNPYYDSTFRTKALELMQREAINEKYPVPQPILLPPKIPERFTNGIPSDNSSAAEPGSENKDKPQSTKL